MIRRGSYKLICCDGDPDQLYDLEHDRLELVNLAESADHAQTHRSLRAQVAARWQLDDLRHQLLVSQRQRRLISRALNRGAHAFWDYQPQLDGAMRYVHSRADLYELQRRARLDPALPPPNPPPLAADSLNSQHQAAVPPHVAHRRPAELRTQGCTPSVVSRLGDSGGGGRREWVCPRRAPADPSSLQA